MSSKHRRQHRPAALAAAVLAAITGLMLIRLSDAATHVTAVEAESGAMAGGATRIESIAGSSAGAAVRFAQPVRSGPSLYVSPDGNDNNDGSQDAPFRTLRKAAGLTTPGVTVRVAPGTYAGGFAIAKGGSATAPVTWLSQQRHGAIITDSVDITGRYVVFQGFTITGPDVRYGLDLVNDDITARDNKLFNLHKFQPTSNGGGGITAYMEDYSPQRNVHIDRNIVYDIGVAPGNDTLVQGIYVSTPCTGCSVTNNIVYDVADFGLHAYHSPAGWLYANNTVYGNGRGILTGPGFTTINNISMNNTSDNYDIRGSGNVLANNLVFGSGGGARSGVTQADPLFLDAATADFRLKPDSPAIDAGRTDGAPRADFAGTARPQGGGTDIGAFER